MMRKILIIAGCLGFAGIMNSCSNRDTGRAYMPDMYYSRAYETYAGYDTSKFTSEMNSWDRNNDRKIFYNNQPVPGTIARGDMPESEFANDTAAAKMNKSPLNVDSIDMTEAQRLYLVNCAVCHGAKLDGNGPLYKDGNGPYPAAPKNFMSDKGMTEGTMFQAATYGKNAMGSYASQLTTKQRWMVVAYIKKSQGGAVVDSSAGKAPVKDSSATAAVAKKN